MNLKICVSYNIQEHRSINGFLFNIMCTLAAYSFFPKKPSLNIKMETSNQLTLAA